MERGYGKISWFIIIIILEVILDEIASVEISTRSASPLDSEIRHAYVSVIL